MTGLLILSHGPLAEGLKESCHFFYDDQRCFHCEVLNKEDDPKEFLQVIRNACNAFHEVDGILIFTDIPGGTPANMAQIVQQENQNIRIISGANLIMVLDALLSREAMQLDDLAMHCLKCGKESIQLLYAETITDDDENAEF